METLIEVLTILAHTFFWTSAISTSIFPLVYMALAPWRKSLVGIGVVILGWSVAASLDLTLILTVWHPSVLIRLLLIVPVLAAITTGSIAKTVAVIILQVRGRSAATRERS